jgi:hypothetical protein
VVDTGLHVKHWTRQQAIDYGMPASEVERYVVWPGQACSYKVGQLKLLALRAMMQEALGDKYSIKAFHNIVLSTGGVPLAVLEDVVAEAVEQGKGVVTVVNGRPLPVSQLDALRQEVADAGTLPGIEPASEAELRDELVLTEIVAQEAMRLGLGEPMRLANPSARDWLLHKRALNLALRRAQKPASEAEVQAAYSAAVKNAASDGALANNTSLPSLGESRVELSRQLQDQKWDATLQKLIKAARTEYRFSFEL